MLTKVRAGAFPATTDALPVRRVERVAAGDERYGALISLFLFYDVANEYNERPGHIM